jgi:hypothetical protein
MYEKIYSIYSAQGEIKQGKTVYVLDRLTKDVFELNNSSVKKMLEIETEQDETRFDMWVEREVENGND